MDILNSRILEIEGRQYVDYSQENKEQDEYCEQEEEQVHRNAPTGGSLTETIACPNALFRHVIGHRGQTIRRLQEETGALIEVPKGKFANGLLVHARTASSLEAAVTRLQLLLSKKRWNEPFLHLITIPLTSRSVKDGYQEFKTEVLARCGGDRGMNERLFQSKDKIHLTIGTLVLLDDFEYEKAILTMQRIQKSDLFKEAMGTIVEVKGIEYMNDDPQMVDVLYAKVRCPKNPGLLQRLADHIVAEFVGSGFMKKEHEHVKLHATVMNTIRTVERKPPHAKGAKKNAERETFNAQNVLSIFKDQEFGSFPLQEIHISCRYTADRSGYYESLYVTNMN